VVAREAIGRRIYYLKRCNLRVIALIPGRPAANRRH
jgi:hypothetical protein